jgi:drug/metabolite transporter (DMT)-like permease
MKTSRLSAGLTNLATSGLAILAAVFVFEILTGRKVPLIEGDRAVLLVLFVIGFALCGLGISKISATGQWTHPLTILGYILGVLTMLIAAAGYFGLRFAFIQSSGSSFIAVSILMIIKFVFAVVHSLI